MVVCVSDVQVGGAIVWGDTSTVGRSGCRGKIKHRITILEEYMNHTQEEKDVPFEFQVLFFIVVHELALDGVCAPCEHTARHLHTRKGVKAGGEIAMGRVWVEHVSATVVSLAHGTVRPLNFKCKVCFWWQHAAPHRAGFGKTGPPLLGRRIPSSSVPSPL